jgi:hypothetical protein
MDSYCKTVFENEKDNIRKHIGNLVDDVEFQKSFNDKSHEQIKCQTYINILYNTGITPIPSPFLHVIIMYVSQVKFANLVNYLEDYLPNCSNINVINSQNWNPIILTIKLINAYGPNNLINVLTLLIKYGVDVNYKLGGSVSALQCSYNLEVSKMLLDVGANFNDITPNYGNYPALKIYNNFKFLSNILHTLVVENIDECDLCFDVKVDCLRCCGKVAHFTCISCIKCGGYNVCPTCNSAYVKTPITVAIEKSQ